VVWQDSLDPNATHGTEMDVVDDFVRFLRARGVTGRLSKSKGKCQRQETNDCAFQAGANLIHAVTGARGNFTRDLFLEIAASVGK